jgi:hypothetical protein
MDDVRVEKIGVGANWAFILFLILILLVFGFGLFCI